MARNIEYIKNKYKQIREEIDCLKKNGMKVYSAISVTAEKHGYKKSWIKKIYYESDK